MGYFQVRYDSRVVIYERKLFIRLAAGFFLVMVVRWLYGEELQAVG